MSGPTRRQAPFSTVDGAHLPRNHSQSGDTWENTPSPSCFSPECVPKRAIYRGAKLCLSAGACESPGGLRGPGAPTRYGHLAGKQACTALPLLFPPLSRRRWPPFRSSLVPPPPTWPPWGRLHVRAAFSSRSLAAQPTYQHNFIPAGSVAIMEGTPGPGYDLDDNASVYNGSADAGAGPSINGEAQGQHSQNAQAGGSGSQKANNSTCVMYPCVAFTLRVIPYLLTLQTYPFSYNCCMRGGVFNFALI